MPVTETRRINSRGFQCSRSDTMMLPHNRHIAYRTGLPPADEPPSAEPCKECQLRLFPLDPRARSMPRVVSRKILMRSHRER